MSRPYRRDRFKLNIPHVHPGHVLTAATLCVFVVALIKKSVKYIKRHRYHPGWCPHHSCSEESGVIFIEGIFGCLWVSATQDNDVVNDVFFQLLTKLLLYIFEPRQSMLFFVLQQQYCSNYSYTHDYLNAILRTVQQMTEIQVLVNKLKEQLYVPPALTKYG